MDFRDHLFTPPPIEELNEGYYEDEEDIEYLNEIGDTPRGHKALIGVMKRNFQRMGNFTPSGKDNLMDRRTITRYNTNARRAFDRYKKHNSQAVSLILNRPMERYNKYNGEIGSNYDGLDTQLRKAHNAAIFSSKWDSPGPHPDYMWKQW